MASVSIASLATSAYQADIFLEKPIYNPGDTLNGQITLRLGRKLCCDRVHVQLFGSARVFFVQKSTDPKTFGHSKPFEQEQVLIDQEQDVWMTMNSNVKKTLTLDDIVRNSSSTAIRMPQNNVENSPGLEQGVHTFNFSFGLPQGGLYTSFDAKDSAGYVRYYILLKVLNGSAAVLRKKLLFAVVCPKILINTALPMKDKVFKERKNFDKGAYLEVELVIDQRVFVPGQPIKGTISIENKSGKSVKYSHLCIKQETICYSVRPEIQIHESSSSTAGIGLTVHKVPTGENLSYPIKFNVPALTPNLDVPNCIQTSYRLQLDVGFIRGSPKCATICIQVPISIGTHLKANDDSLPTYPPPAYEEIENRENFGALYPQFPPEYSASMMGLSTIEDADQKDYSPLCYHYNFAFEDDDEKKNK